MKGLIIKGHWLDLILSGMKPWEIRGSNTSIRGRIALIKSGTGMIFGTVELFGVKNLTQWDLLEYHEKHRVYDLDDIPYRQPRAWVLQNPVKFDKPIPYKHKQGAVIWVNLPDDILANKRE
jgi:hypothetical protein